MTVVRFENISKYFGDVIAVNKMNYQTQDGEFLTLLGPSGCGKTTTLRMVAGFYYPTEGAIRFNDRDVTYLPPESRNTGMVFQNYALFPHMTVFENVAYGLQARRMKKPVIQEKVARVLKLVQMDGYEGRKVHQLSGGQQQRVALARALVIEPDILLLDEPLSNLDAKLRRTTAEELRKIQKELGITTIYVTHDQEEAFSVSDRIIVMHQGNVHQIDTPADIFNRPKDTFVAEFLGHANLVGGRIAALNEGYLSVKTEWSDQPLKVDLRRQRSEWKWQPGEDVTVMIHTNQIRLATVDGAENTVKGTLRFIMFHGLNWLLEVQVGQQVCRMVVPNDASGVYRRLSVGDVLTVQFPPEEVYLIKKDGRQQ